MGRKSQVEKFNARMGKAKLDEQVIKQAEAKRSQEEECIMKKGEKVMKSVGGNPEDVFMVIARDSVEQWTKMWNNSMENVIKTEVRKVVREVVQEELESAVRSVFSGVTEGLQSMLQTKVQEQVEDVMFGSSDGRDTDGDIYVEEEQTPEQVQAELADELEIKIDKWIKDDEIPMTPQGKISWTKAQRQGILKQVYLKVMKHADDEGLNLERPTQLQKAGGNYGGMYQHINRQYKKETSKYWVQLLSEYKEIVNN